MLYLNNQIKTLPCPWIDLAKNSNKKNARRFGWLLNPVGNSYSTYEASILAFDKPLIKSKFRKSKSILIDYYKCAPSKLDAELKKRRTEHGLSMCPFCGNPKSPDTLDHFIPKDEWPEYSILSNNLVPQCRDCAPIKGTKYFCEEENIAKFVHPFYSSLLSKTEFRVFVNFNEETYEIDFDVKIGFTEEINDQEKARLCIHSRSLDIKNRAKKYCYKEFLNWKRKARARRFDIQTAFDIRRKELLGNTFKSDWKSSLYDEFLKNEALLEYFTSLMPVKNVRHIKEIIDFLE